jgi:hypothetical protein
VSDSVRPAPAAIERSPDPDALLCALVLAPDTWSRNRFYRMFEDPRARRARRRAAQVRSVVASLRARGGDVSALLPEPDDAGGDVEIVVEVPSASLVRRSVLSPLELRLVRYVLRCGQPEASERDRARIEGALGRLL